jgi:hypothetical protein
MEPDAHRHRRRRRVFKRGSVSLKYRTDQANLILCRQQRSTSTAGRPLSFSIHRVSHRLLTRSAEICFRSPIPHFHGPNTFAIVSPEGFAVVRVTEEPATMSSRYSRLQCYFDVATGVTGHIVGTREWSPGSEPPDSPDACWSHVNSTVTGRRVS